MIITKNGYIETTPKTSMVDIGGGLWMNLLVCPVPVESKEEDLIKLFDTDFVEDDIIEVRWEYTQFYRITADENNKYVWLTYAIQNLLRESKEELDQQK